MLIFLTCHLKKKDSKLYVWERSLLQDVVKNALITFLLRSCLGGKQFSPRENQIEYLSVYASSCVHVLENVGMWRSGVDIRYCFLSVSILHIEAESLSWTQSSWSGWPACSGDSLSSQYFDYRWVTTPSLHSCGYLARSSDPHACEVKA